MFRSAIAAIGHHARAFVNVGSIFEIVRGLDGGQRPHRRLRPEPGDETYQGLGWYGVIVQQVPQSAA